MNLEWQWLWKTILIVVAGAGLLRIAGRKSISQMTTSQTVIMIAIGSLLIQPVSGKSIWVAFSIAAIMVVTLISLEWVQLKLNWVEKLITGSPVPLIVHGKLQERNLKKVRLTLDLLDNQLRQKSVLRRSDVKHAILEPGGQITVVLNESAQMASKQDLVRLSKDVHTLRSLIEQLLEQGKVQAGGQTTGGSKSEAKPGHQKGEKVSDPSTADLFLQVIGEKGPASLEDRLQ
ncbi:DUF421 domain-containing protein [Paenibacillus sambharensis]|uniref:DUF421 domain-containing protein n=1 Tax=Paenibacillus sambharensis TaxID=1803190 RepID=A0A2W1LAK7_9BACL|nr:YetF domain-containing protein [Paenibacillus sambharensis]PZD96256.1 DUF421 domain-containing protein [Paenibacillus sambharensis]